MHIKKIFVNIRWPSPAGALSLTRRAAVEGKICSFCSQRSTLKILAERLLLLLISLLIFLLISSNTFAKTSIKKSLLTIYESHPVTFLSEIPFDKKGIAQIKFCAQCPTQSTPIQWISVVPASQFLKNKMCYEQKLCIDKKGNRFSGIRCCHQKDALFKSFEKDLHQLVPELPAFKKQFYSTPQSDFNNNLKGPLSRIKLYMRLKYRYTLSAKEQNQYEQWHRQYPPTEWERKRNQLIKQRQGDSNPYIEN